MGREDTKQYLKKFGFLKSPTVEAFGFAAHKAFVDDDDAVEEALKAFQAYFHLPVTGEMDDATFRLMNTKRCGFPDVGSFVLHSNKWPSGDLTYAFAEMTRKLPLEDAKRAMREGYQAWAQVANMSFTETTPDQAIMINRFVNGDHGDGNPFDGVGQVLAHCFFPTSHPLGGDAHFDDTEAWTFGMLRTVAAHEYGHGFGLAHSNDPTALMYPYFTGAREPLLGTDDRNGIIQLYGARVDTAPQPVPLPPPTPQPTPTPQPQPTQRVFRLLFSNVYHDEHRYSSLRMATATWYDSIAQAKAAGNRPCGTCKPVGG